MTSTKLNSKYTFRTFVIAQNNAEAFNAAVSVAEKPASLYNPLWICAWGGMGKTHLLHAIGHRALKTHPRIRVIYIPAKDIMQVKRKKVDVLLIDDMHLLNNDLINLFKIVNELLSKEVQIILTCKGSPEGLEEIVSSMFKYGRVAYINPPDKKTLIDVLNKVAETKGFVANEKMLERFLEEASSITPDFQVIRNAFGRYLLYQRMLSKTPSPEVVKWLVNLCQ